MDFADEEAELQILSYLFPVRDRSDIQVWRLERKFHGDKKDFEVPSVSSGRVRSCKVGKGVLQ